MSGPRPLNVESNPPNLIAAQGYRAMEQCMAAFVSLESSTDCRVGKPHAANFGTSLIGQFDDFVFAGSGVYWGVDEKEVAPLSTVMERLRMRKVNVGGMQYHPKCPTNAITKSVGQGDGIFSVVSILIDDLEVGDNDIVATERLGTTRDSLQPVERARIGRLAYPCKR